MTTYTGVNGVWRYVYRAVDQYGQVIDVLVSARRDTAAARRFLRRALSALKVVPTEVVTDAAPVYPAVLDELIAAQHPTPRLRPALHPRGPGQTRCIAAVVPTLVAAGLDNAAN
jgi:transposase-like protein